MLLLILVTLMKCELDLAVAENKGASSVYVKKASMYAILKFDGFT